MTTLALDTLPMATESHVERAQRGDLRAFNELVLQYERLVFSVCYRLLGERQTAEDAAQETFIAAWRNIDRVRPESFRGWLLTIASNTSKSQLRRRSRRPEASLDLAVEAEDSLPRPDDLALQNELRSEIQDGLAALSTDQRQALLLWHEAGLSYEEIAQVTRSSIGTVKSRLFRGRQRLAELLRDRVRPNEFRTAGGSTLAG